MTHRKQLRIAVAAAWMLLTSYCCFAAQQGTEAEIRKYSVEAENATEANDLPRAAAALEKLARLTPDVPQVHARLGLTYYLQNRYAEALSSLERAARLDPGLPNVKSLTGICLTQMGRYNEAAKVLGPAFRSSRDEKLARVMGLDLMRAYRAMKDYPQAEQVSAELLRHYPDDPEVLYNCSRLHGEESLNLIVRMMKSAPNSAWVPLTLAEINEDEKRYDAAITQYRIALQRDPHLPGAHLSLGRVLLLSSNSPDATAAALKEFTNELEIDPQNPRAEYEIGEIYRRQGTSKAAIEHLERATELDPDLADAQIALARTLMNMQRAKEAIPHLQRAVRSRPSDEVSHFLLATAYAHTGDRVGQQRELALYRKYHVRPYTAGTHGDIQLPPGLTSPDVTPQSLDTGPQVPE